jgi:hypothetical protein
MATLPFIIIPVLLVVLLVCGVHVTSGRRAGMITMFVAVAWMAATWSTAASGVLRDFQRTPPPFALLVAGVVALACVLAFGGAGARLAAQLPLWVLVGVQGFRLPLELAMHRMYELGIMPVQMSYEGQNYDILTGATALIVAVLLKTGVGGRVVVAVWNVFGLALLVNIVTIAILSTPRFAYYGRDRLNVWVMDPPYVWLPAVMVLAALAGHLLIFRAVTRGTARRRR